MQTMNKQKDVFLTKAQFEARKTAGTLEEGIIYHTTDETVLTPTGVKTLFGDQHIYGTGNIDLFCHMIAITDTDGNVDCLFDFYSSKNLKCDSLADLKTLLGNTFTRKCNGIVKDGDTTKVVYKITETSLVFTDGTTKVLLGVTFQDVVKTI